MAFWKPGTVAPGSTIDRESQAEGTLTLSSATAAPSISQRATLPIYKQREQLLHLIENYPTVILQGETGTGKSTQLPQYLMEAGWAADGMVVGCTQPRRVAATSVAARVAQEVGSILGDEVGYAIRFEDMSSPSRTRIKYLTDGMLFRETMLDPLLSRYSVIMIDEAHERSSYTDLLLGVIKKIQKKRPELRVIISSATIDAQYFLSYFNTNTTNDPKFDDAAIISLEGRMFPVEISYLEEPTLSYLDSTVQTVIDIHLHQPAGDVLVFLTGREEIDVCTQAIADQLLSIPATTSKLIPLPLHAGLTNEEQMLVFEPAQRGTRKVVISTNIAEASITIEGIRYVVDCGHVKLRTFNPKTGMDVLSVTPASQASAAQRAGRAGRTSSGKCFRLYPSAAFKTLPKSTPPEICRSDISLFVLQLKSLGIQNVVKGFDWVTNPPSAMLSRALEYLFSLGALDAESRLTLILGTRMAELPVDPAMAKILLGSEEFGCSEEILSIAAMTSVQNVFIQSDGADGAISDIERRKFTAEEGDHLTLLNAYLAFVKVGKQSSKWCHTHRLNFKALSRAVSIRNQLSKYLKRFNIAIKSCGDDHAKIRRCLVSGYFKNAAKMQPDGTYRSIRENAELHVHPSSVLFTRTAQTGYVIFHEVVETSKSFMRDLTVIDKDWLTELSGGFYVEKDRR